MKLAEALVERKNLKDEIEVLKQRAGEYASIQEGNKPLGSVNDLLKRIEEKVAKLGELIVKINWYNVNYMLVENNVETVGAALIRRDMLRLKKIIFDHISDSAASSASRYGSAEIRLIPTIEVEDMRKQADGLAKEYRELDAKIQARNWEIEIG